MLVHSLTRVLLGLRRGCGSKQGSDFSSPADGDPLSSTGWEEESDAEDEDVSMRVRVVQ